MTSITDWLLSTVSSGALVTALAFLLRNLILTRLKASIAHEFNTKIESLRTALRNSEESFKADLRAKEAQIEVLRSGAMSGLTSRQAVLDKRRLGAIEQLWDSIEKLAPLKMASSVMASVDFTKSLELLKQKPRARDAFKDLPKIFGLDKPPEKLGAHKARPFLPEIVWALFSAYQAILQHMVLQIRILAGELDPDLLDKQHVSKLAKAAMPSWSQHIDEVGPAGYYDMLEPLESELLKELQRMMRGEESDKATVEQAAKIMKEVANVNEEISKGVARNVQAASN